MKHRRMFSMAAILVSAAVTVSAHAATQCEVKRLVELDADVPDVSVMTPSGEKVELRSLVQAFLIPVKAQTGVYRVNVRRKSSNLYDISGKNLLIETRHCYQYVYGQDAMLEINSVSGWSIGTLSFE